MKAAERKPLAPVTGTDQTCFEITGLQWRNVRPWLVEHGVPLVKVGRRWVFRIDLYLAALDRAAGAQPRAHWDEASFLAELDGSVSQ